MQKFVVEAAHPKGSKKSVIVSDEKGNRATLKVHRFALVGQGNTIVIDSEHTHNVFVLDIDSNVKIKVTPHFEKDSECTIGDDKYSVKIKEITNDEDLEAYSRLEEYHYKTCTLERSDEDVESESVGGRRAVLLAYIRVNGRQIPAGYIELQMPLLMVKPRHDIFNKINFDHTGRGVHWKQWDQYSIKKYVNLIVRIARVVTSPELRGLGLSKTLIGTAKDFANERWHVGGKKPLFMEISAEMLRYIDFVSSSGLKFAGLTEGNIKRVAKDLFHMQKEYKISSGIMSLQKKYLTDLKKAADRLSLDMPVVMDKLKEISANPAVLNTLSPAEYYMFRSVVRVPIPYHIGGLDSYSERCIASVTADIPREVQYDYSARSKHAKIEICGLSIFSSFSLKETKNTQSIMDCFGLKGHALTNSILKSVDIKASQGNVFFISGASGSGKSMLLHALDKTKQLDSIVLRYISDNSTNYSAGWLSEIESEEPLIEYFAAKWGMTRSLINLNRVGLSEAYIYLKPYKMLSRGQQYRARIADLVLRNHDVWLIDEFCSDLDPLSAKIVSKNLKKQAIRSKAIVFIAAANHGHFLSALHPTKVIVLRQGFDAVTVTYKEYKDDFCN